MGEVTAAAQAAGAHRVPSILKQIETLSLDVTKARAAENPMKLIANSVSAAKVAPPEMVQEAGSNKFDGVPVDNSLEGHSLWDLARNGVDHAWLSQELSISFHFIF